MLSRRVGLSGRNRKVLRQLASKGSDTNEVGHVDIRQVVPAVVFDDVNGLDGIVLIATESYCVLRN